MMQMRDTLTCPWKKKERFRCVETFREWLAAMGTMAVELVYDDCTRHVVRRVSVIIENLIASVYI
jgi:hypothetical protein